MQYELVQVTLEEFTYHPYLIGSYFTENNPFSSSPTISGPVSNLRDTCLIHPTRPIKLIPLNTRLIDRVLPMYYSGLNNPLIQPWINTNVTYDYDSIRKSTIRWIEDNQRIHYIIVDNSEFPAVFIGHIWFQFSDPDKVDLFSYLNCQPDKWGQGIVSDSFILALTHLAKQGIRMFQTYTDNTNTISIKILMKAGFRYTGPYYSDQLPDRDFSLYTLWI